MDISVGCRLRYTMAAPTYFVFQIVAAEADSQVVRSERLVLPPNAAGQGYETYCDPLTGTRRIRALLGPGPVEVLYEATVDVDAQSFDPASVREFAFADVPMQHLHYITPSRYCPSDTFTQFAHDTFGAMPPGHARVTAICDWIFHNIRYLSGSTGPSTNASEVFNARQGVCRDFAHLGISLTRALGIPARYACVYADRLSPQDFHAVFQAFLLGPNGGAWFSFDPTRMACVEQTVRIAAGLDAADVAFAWPQGPVDLSVPPEVWAHAAGRSNTERSTAAVSA